MPIHPKKAVFIERDGVLNVVNIESGHQKIPTSLGQFKIHDDAIPAIVKLKKAGLLVIVTTNQPGLSDGTLNRRELDQMHTLLRKTLPIDDIMVCPHTDADECPCRKPKPGLFIEAAFKWNLTLETSYIITNKWQDIKVSKVIGATAINIESSLNSSDRNHSTVKNIDEAVEKILKIATVNHGHFEQVRQESSWHR